jgi:DNA-binding MarR family transcriptional regulator
MEMRKTAEINLIQSLSGLHQYSEQRLLAKLNRSAHPDVRPAHVSVIFHLGYERIRLTDLAERAGITQQAMGKLVKQLMAMEYLSRSIDNNDRRAKIIEATEKGQQLIADLQRCLNELTQEYMDLLGQEQLDTMQKQLSSTLEKVKAVA